MSLFSIRQPVQIHILWGDIKGKSRIQSALHVAITEALTRAVDRTILLMKEIVPESIKKRPPYSQSHQKRSEALMRTAIDILEQSMTDLTAGGFKRRYFLKFGFTASYARYINRKRNVRNWSKQGSKTGFAGSSKQLLIKAVREELQIELSQNPQLRGFIGAKKYG